MRYLGSFAHGIQTRKSSNHSTVDSVTRLGDFLDFGQLFKPFCCNYFAQIAHILGNFCKGVKIHHFSSEIIFGQLLLTFGDFSLVTLTVDQIC